MPSFNSEKYIERALLSIFKQEYQGSLQVIISDGGSTDGTIGILRKYPQTIWWSEPDDGPIHAVIKALGVATGEFIAYLSSDDFYLKDSLKKVVSRIVDNRAFDFASGALVYLNEDENTFYLGKKHDRTISNPLDFIAGKVEIPLQSTVLRKQAFDDIGGFRPEAGLSCDVDLLYRMLHLSKGILIPEHLSVFQVHMGQYTRSVPEEWIRSMRFVVESCEKDDRYARVFKLPERVKRELDTKRQMFWYSYCGGVDGAKRARDIADKVLKQKTNHSKELVGYARTIAASKSGIIGRSAASALNGSIIKDAMTVAKNLYMSRKFNGAIDINWWKK